MIKPTTYTKSRNNPKRDKDSAQAITKWTVAAYDPTAGIVEPAVAGTTVAEVAGVFSETVTAAAGLDKVNVLETGENDEFVADTTNNSNANHNGQLMVLTNAGEVNNTGTTDPAGIVQQIGVVGNPADRQIIVRFVKTV